MPGDEARCGLRWAVYSLLIAVAVGNMAGRLMAVNSVNRPTAERPFLSANDRSRWATIRSLVELGTYEIDAIITEPGWDTIDRVKHTGRDGQLHSYSSKPPLLATLLAGEYWLVHRLTGATLGTHPYAIGRLMLVTTNIVPLVLMWVLVARLVERFGETDWGRLFVMAVATLGTFLGTFAVVLNNHLPAAVSAAVALYAVVRIWCDGRRRPGWFVVAGLAATFTVACELPALAFLAMVAAALLWRAPRETLQAFVPAALVVVVAAVATNYAAHADWKPAYAHPEWYEFTEIVRGQPRASYWSNPNGIDRGEPSRAVYAMHALVGHHGIFSLTPVWLLSIAGTWQWLRSGDTNRRNLAVLVATLTVVCLVFYLGLRPQVQRNYGGMTSGFRWMFWFTPLWLVVMLPAADRLSRSRMGQSVALVLLTFSVLSASYPTWNPWTHPWIYHWMNYCGSAVLGGQ